MAVSDIDASCEAPSILLVWAARLERALFWICVAAAGSLMWLAPKLPLTDLPQHAAQITLWRDLLKDVSPWSHIVFVNLLTPYLIGYGSALPLSFFMPVETAIAVVLTAAFYVFVAACVALRRELGSDERLDWLFLLGFFGFDWKWGFYTYLTAAPVLLFFLLFALRYRRTPSFARGLGLFAMGVGLLFSHGLLFLFGLFVAGLLLLGGLRESLRARGTRLAPILALTLVLAAFALATHERGTAAHFGRWEFGPPIWLRPLSALLFVTSDNWNPDLVLATLTALAMATPFFIGWRLNRGAPQIMFAALAAIFLLVPAYALQTGYLFARFALFLPPFFAFLFSRAEPAPGSEGGERAARLAMAAACVVILAVQAWRVHAFNADAAAFDTVEQAAAPDRRALGIVFNGASPAAHADKAFVHFAAWYQADRGGFVDFNFAELHPQVVRFRPGKEPAVGIKFVGDNAGFDWRKDQGWIYDYFFVRGARDPLAWLKGRSPCRLSLAAEEGPWALVRRDSCPTKPPQAAR